MAERDVADGGADELVPGALQVGAVAHFGEAEGVEHVRVGVLRLVVVRGARRGGEERALRDQCPVSKGDVLHGLAGERDYRIRVGA